MKSRFDFYEIVKVVSSDPELEEINNSNGIIMGKAQNEITGNWGYSVAMLKDDIAWSVMEKDLQATGQRVDKDYYRSGVTIRVQVDPKTGYGKIVDSEHESS